MRPAAPRTPRRAAAPPRRAPHLLPLLALMLAAPAAAQHIEQTVPGTTFNFDFWKNNQPRRSTYPACRAALAARQQNPAKEREVITGVQNAYYQRAMNPSNDDTLVQVATENGLDPEKFAADLQSAETHQALLDEIRFARSIGGDSFPSLIMQEGEQLRLIMLSYTDANHILRQL